MGVAIRICSPHCWVAFEGLILPFIQKVGTSPRVDRVDIWVCADRFAQRSWAPPKAAGKMREEATAKVPHRRIGKPRKIDPQGRFPDSADGKVNLVFRFPVSKSIRLGQSEIYGAAYLAISALSIPQFPRPPAIARRNGFYRLSISRPNGVSRNPIANRLIKT